MTQPIGGVGMQGGPVVHFDAAHGPFPDHADMIEPADFGSTKVRVDGYGSVLSVDPVFSNEFLRGNG